MPPTRCSARWCAGSSGSRDGAQRHWRSYGTDPLPTPAEALADPFVAFPSWFLRIECDRCGKVVIHNESMRPVGASAHSPTSCGACVTTAAEDKQSAPSC
jgi:hypothetical protein